MAGYSKVTPLPYNADDEDDDDNNNSTENTDRGRGIVMHS